MFKVKGSEERKMFLTPAKGEGYRSDFRGGKKRER